MNRYYLGPWQREDDHYVPPAGAVGVVDLRGQDPGGHALFVADTTLPSEYEEFPFEVGARDRNRWQDLLGVRPIGDTIVILLWDTLTRLADPDGASLCPPLTATSTGHLELHLGGHSLVRRRRFTGPGDPAWPRLQLLLRRLYSRHRDIGTDIHRRWLWVQHVKYRVPWQSVIPPGMPQEPPLPPRTLTRDDFERPGESPGQVSDLAGSEAHWDGTQGWQWVVHSSEFQTVQEDVDAPTRVRSAGTITERLARSNRQLSSDDNEAQISRAITGGNFTHSGPTARFLDRDNFYHARRPTNDSIQLLKWEGGSATSFGSTPTGAQVTGDTFRCEVDGSTIRAVFNDDVLLTVTDSGVPSGLFTGIRMFSFDSWGTHFTSRSRIPPGAINDLAAQVSGSFQVTLSATTPTPPGDTYDIRRKIGDGDFEIIAEAVLPDTTNGNMTFVLDEQPAGFLLTFQLRGTNDFGATDWSNEAKVTIPFRICPGLARYAAIGPGLARYSPIGPGLARYSPIGPGLAIYRNCK